MLCAVLSDGKWRIGTMDQFSRTELLVGAEGIERLRNSRVAVFGIGGVGGYVVEALARSGVGTLDLIDNDKVSLTNLNRQIIAMHSTIGRYKVDVAKKRVLDINPAAVVNTYRTFFVPETAADFDFHAYDYVVDAIDTVTGKIQLIVQADSACTPVISCMGAGNKMDPTAFRVADIYQTSVCPLAKVMRRELKKRGIRKLKVVYSEEVPIEVKAAAETEKKRIPGSNAFVPSVAGLIMAGEVVRELLARA
jgi:tRNA A37 threonylcarbamoyladenosine dehydratase